MQWKQERSNPEPSKDQRRKFQFIIRFFYLNKQLSTWLQLNRRSRSNKKKCLLHHDYVSLTPLKSCEIALKLVENKLCIPNLTGLFSLVDHWSKINQNNVTPRVTHEQSIVHYVNFYGFLVKNRIAFFNRNDKITFSNQIPPQ